MHEALLLADRAAQQEALMKNDEGIKETGSSGIHLVDTNSSPCLEFNYKSRESVCTRLLIMKTHNNLKNDIALVSVVRESRSYTHFQCSSNNALKTMFNLQSIQLSTQDSTELFFTKRNEKQLIIWKQYLVKQVYYFCAFLWRPGSSLQTLWYPGTS